MATVVGSQVSSAAITVAPTLTLFVVVTGAVLYAVTVMAELPVAIVGTIAVLSRTIVDRREICFHRNRGFNEMRKVV